LVAARPVLPSPAIVGSGSYANEAAHGAGGSRRITRRDDGSLQAGSCIPLSRTCGGAGAPSAGSRRGARREPRRPRLLARAKGAGVRGDTNHGLIGKLVGLTGRSLVLGAVLLAGSHVGTAAQETEAAPAVAFGDASPFQPLLADPLEPRTSVTFLETDLFESSGRPPERPAFSLSEDARHRRCTSRWKPRRRGIAEPNPIPSANLSPPPLAPSPGVRAESPPTTPFLQVFR